MVRVVAGIVLLCFHGPILTMVICFAGDDKQLLVQGEDECVQAAQGREWSGVRAPDIARQLGGWTDGMTEVPRDDSGTHPHHPS
jgi:hypothetical protein